MKPIKFEGVNITYAEDQPEYIPLPTVRFPNVETIQCWELSPAEIEEVTRTGRVFVSQWTFGQKLQPISLSVEKTSLFPGDYEEFDHASLKVGDRLLLWDTKGRDYFGCTVIVEERKFFQVSMAEYGVYELRKGSTSIELINFKVMAKIKNKQ